MFTKNKCVLKITTEKFTKKKRDTPVKGMSLIYLILVFCKMRSKKLQINLRDTPVQEALL